MFFRDHDTSNSNTNGNFLCQWYKCITSIFQTFHLDYPVESPDSQSYNKRQLKLVSEDIKNYVIATNTIMVYFRRSATLQTKNYFFGCLIGVREFR